MKFLKNRLYSTLIRIKIVDAVVTLKIENNIFFKRVMVIIINLTKIFQFANLVTMSRNIIKTTQKHYCLLFIMVWLIQVGFGFRENEASA